MSTQLAPQTLSAAEAFAALGIGKSLGYRLIEEGQFPVRVLRLGKAIRISRHDLDAYLRGVDADEAPAA